MQLSNLERDFINAYQGGFPLQERPFRSIAARLNCSEDRLIESVRQLKNRNLLSRFGPLYDAAALGGGLTLAAMTVPEERYQAVTAMVNAYPQVAHNYRREHALNMWFVVATESPGQIAEVLTAIEQQTRLRVYDFPKQHEFYIGLWLQLCADGRHTTVPVPAAAVSSDKPCLLDATDRRLISLTQDGLSIEACPYQKVAQQLGCSQQQVLQRLQSMLDCAIIRRIGAVPNHYRLGLTANGMSVWDVDENRVLELGNIIGRLDFVSHCYQRPRQLPVWPYNLFAMVHGHNRDEVREKVSHIESILGRHNNSHEILFSSAILKKTGLRLVVAKDQAISGEVRLALNADRPTEPVIITLKEY